MGTSNTMRTKDEINGRMGYRRNSRWAAKAATLLVLSFWEPVHGRLETLRQEPNVASAQDSDLERLHSLERLWETEALLAQSEAERVLFNWKDIFNSLPTNKPTPRPVPQPRPTPQPTLPPTPQPLPTTIRPTLPNAQSNAPTSTPLGPVTSAPTPQNCLVGTNRDAFLLAQLSQITSATLLTNPSTPQGRAFNFMVNDPLLPDVCTYPTINQRFAMATLYYSTNGEGWVSDTGWLSATRECGWQGVFCQTDFITSLVLEQNNLVGTLPEEFGVLTTLEQLELANNVLSGSLPLSMADLTRLEVLDLENNQLNGEPLPPQLLLLTNLVQVFLSNNPYQTSSLPQEIIILSKLSDFWVANGNLFGVIPTGIGVLTNLRTLILYGNELDGTLPTEIGALTNMENLQLQNNQMARAVPSEVFNLVKLEVLRLDFNFFTGNLPQNIGNIVEIQDLRLNDNFMRGSIPDTVGQLTNLELVSFGSNFFVGTIPRLNSEVLDTADFARATFSGPIPTFFFSIPTIRLLYLNNNALTGTIPQEFAQAPLLRDFFVNNNNLVGTVPAIQPGQLLNLNELTLQANSLTGSVPQSICNLRQAGILFNLFSDCGGATPEIQCTFPSCCNRCFQ